MRLLLLILLSTNLISQNNINSNIILLNDSSYMERGDYGLNTYKLNCKSSNKSGPLSE